MKINSLIIQRQKYHLVGMYMEGTNGMLGHELYLEIMNDLPRLVIKSDVLGFGKLEHVSYVKESLFVYHFYQCPIL